jgi:hypothetical protein
LPEYAVPSEDGTFYLGADQSAPMSVTGFDWTVTLNSGDTSEKSVGGEAVRVWFDTATGIALVRVGSDTVRFELLPVLARVVDSIPTGRGVRAELLQVEPVTGARRARLMLGGAGGKRSGDTLLIRHWSGLLLLGARPPG